MLLAAGAALLRHILACGNGLDDVALYGRAADHTEKCDVPLIVTTDTFVTTDNFHYLLIALKLSLLLILARHRINRG